MTAFPPFFFPAFSPKANVVLPCSIPRKIIEEKMALGEAKEESSPEHSKDGRDEVLTPSTQEDDCIRRLMYAKSPEFDEDIAKTHSIVKEELKLAREVNEQLQHELDDMKVQAATMNERYKHLKRRHTAFRDDVDEWRVIWLGPWNRCLWFQLESYLLLQAAVWCRSLWFQTECYRLLKAAVLLLQLVP